MLRGTLTWVPGLNAWRACRGSTGGSDSARYCYSVWLRHLVTLKSSGFDIKGSQIGELGPGDSIGIGLAALLSGAAGYVGLDIVPFSAKANLEKIFDELVQLYCHRTPIPNENEFPLVRPRLDSYEFPDQLVERTHLTSRAEKIRRELKTRLNYGKLVSYRAPWTSPDDIAPASLDLVFSQAVLEHVDNLEETYRIMSIWLKCGGYVSHVIDFSAHYLAHFWNGHWAYTDWEWRLVRGRREFLLNRYPISAHLEYAKRAGFKIVKLEKHYNDAGLPPCALTNKFRTLDPDDLRTQGAVVILRKQ
jgi:hypothetical protein